MSVALSIIVIAITLLLAFLAFAFYVELKWAEDEIRALRETIDNMHANRSLRPSTLRRSETLILRK